MLLKWMVCQLEDTQRDAFFQAQQQWSAIASAPGFHGQMGGWDRKTPSRPACITGFWEDEAAYQHFMSEIHDTITDSNQQEATYTSLTNSFFQRLFSIPGTLEDWNDIQKQARILRIADCRIHDSAHEHFREAQQQVWNPGMKDAGGMLGGQFFQSTTDPQRYMVMTAWDSLESHTNYMDHHFSGLLKRAEAVKDLRSVEGYLLELAPAWLVEAK